jgi:uncharacterized protein (DUF58 family)
MAKPSTAGAYVTLEELVLLEHRTRGAFSFLPRQPVHSLLSGRHASRIRGRGLNFEELRGYLPGDDVRSIDWKVTARTGKPHVRVFTEERDRASILVVDQRLAMFFGTKKNMKSVTAAELAAAGAWRVLDQGDRPGAVVFDDAEVREVRAHRSRHTVLQILHLLVDKNRALRADSERRPDPSMLNRALEGVARAVTQNCLVVILSDFDGADDDTTRIVTNLSRHNDILAVPVYDPSSAEIPSGVRIVVSDGEMQVELDAGKASTRRRVIEIAGRRLASVMAWQDDLGIPVLPISAGEDSLDQVRVLLGQAVQARGR